MLSIIGVQLLMFVQVVVTFMRDLRWGGEGRGGEGRGVEWRG